VFLLGLDQHYRDAMKLHEAKVLSGCARAVAERLGVAGEDVPVEGYYGDPELPELRHYFVLMRALMRVNEGEAAAARGMPELERLRTLMGSGMYGVPAHDIDQPRKMLPAGRDPLSRALKALEPDLWAVPRLVERAGEEARRHDDISLVGLAARAGDAVALASMRESVVLYAEKVVTIGADETTYEYVWQVGDELARAANRFIEIFNRLVAPENARLDKSLRMNLTIGWHAYRPIPLAEAANAPYFFHTAEDNEVMGRCVHLGTRLDRPDGRYHWAVRRSSKPEGPALEVEEFWSKDLWTTDRYRAERKPQSPGRARGPGPPDHLEIVS
jgi:hypothetical protein